MTNDRPEAHAQTDFYTLVHKALRKRLFDTLVLAGTTDLTDDAARATLATKVVETVRAIREHAEHEERFIHPLLTLALPEEAQARHREHEEHEGALDAVERAFAAAMVDKTPTAGHRAYRTLAIFIADVLRHTEEEEAMQPRLWAKVDEARLAEAMGAFRASRTLDQALASCGEMLPAMTPVERAAMFRNLRMGAPTPVFDAMSAIAERTLEGRGWEELRAALHGNVRL